MKLKLFFLLFLSGCFSRGNMDIEDDINFSLSVKKTVDGIYTSSVTNNFLSSRNYSKNEIKNQIAKISHKSINSGKQAQDDLKDLITYKRFAGSELNSVLEDAKKYARYGIKKDSKTALPEDVLLELAYSSLHAKQAGKAFFFLDNVIALGNSKFKALAYNAYGVVALQNDSTVIANEYFRLALKEHESCLPAMLNLGLLAVKYGDYVTARNYLSKIDDDWLAEFGNAISERMLGNPQHMKEFCDSKLEDLAKNKSVVYSCGIYYQQEEKNIVKARELLTKAIALSPKEQQVDTVASRILKTLGQK